LSPFFPFRQILPTKVLSFIFYGKLKNVPSAAFVLLNPTIINPLVINFTEYVDEILEILVSPQDFNKFA
jgi:hypothetical protein